MRLSYAKFLLFQARIFLFKHIKLQTEKLAFDQTVVNPLHAHSNYHSFSNRINRYINRAELYMLCIGFHIMLIFLGCNSSELALNLARGSSNVCLILVLNTYNDSHTLGSAS